MLLVLACTLACGEPLVLGDGGADRPADAALSDAGSVLRDGGPPLSCRPAGSECDLLLQDCGDGLACRYTNTSGAGRIATCEPDGERGRDAPCTGDAECRAGLRCADGRCAAYCCSDHRSCPIDQFCGQESDVSHCRDGTPCNLLDGTGCPDPDESCYLNGPYTDCLPTGPLTEGEPCSGRPNACGPGLLCVAAPSEAVCRPVCVFGGGCDGNLELRCDPSAELPGLGVWR